MALSTKQVTRQLSRILATRFRLVSFIVVALILLIGGFFFLYPKFSEIRTVGVFDLQRTQNQLDLKRQIVDETQNLTKIYDNLNLDDVAKLQELLPKEEDLPNLFVQVEAIATASNLRLENVGFTDLGAAAKAAVPVAAAATTDETTGTTTTPKTTATPVTHVTAASLHQVSVSFTVSGSSGYNDLKTFLTNVESSIRIFDIQSLSYAPTGQAEQYQINAITYYLQ